MLDLLPNAYLHRMLVLNFPSFPELQTDRLILRSYVPSDAPALFAMRTNEEVMRYIDRERPKDIDAIELMITQMIAAYQQQKSLVWAIALKENPALMIGSIGYYRTDFGNYRAEIGYMLMPDFWRKGIIAECLQKTITFGFEEMGLHSISANINPDNEASRQILLKHGFVKEAYFKENYFFNGQFLDTEIYSLLEPKD